MPPRRDARLGRQAHRCPRVCQDASSALLSCLSLSSYPVTRSPVVPPTSGLSPPDRLSGACLLSTRSPLSQLCVAEGSHPTDHNATSPVKLRASLYGCRCRKLTQLHSRGTSPRFHPGEGSKAPDYACAAISRFAGISALAPYRSTNSDVSRRIAGFADYRPSELPGVTLFTLPCPVGLPND